MFPGDTALAWQYKYYHYMSGDTLFAQDSAQTIGLKLTIYRAPGDTVFFDNLNLNNDFTNLGGGNEQTDWILSKFPLFILFMLLTKAGF